MSSLSRVSTADVAVIGCGYLGQRVAGLLSEQGASVVAVTRSPQRAERFARRGWQTLVGDLGQGVLPRRLTVGSLLFSLGSDRRDDRPVCQVWSNACENVLRSVATLSGPIVYVSTTGVYGPSPSASVIDEDSAPAPQRAAAKAHLQMERRWAESVWSERCHVLRMGGLYSADRLPQLAKLRAGQSLTVAPDHWLNLIHGDDAARIVVAALTQWQGAGMTVVTDGRPVTRGDFYRHAARCLGLEPPTFDVDRSDRSSGSADARIIRSRHFETRIRPLLRYPDYRSGLEAALGAPR